jgi:hemoglobin
MTSLQTPEPSDFVELVAVRLTFQDIHQVVDRFYTQVQHDSLLSVPFQSVQDWPTHIERITHFWWTRFGGTPYKSVQYNPVLKHFEAGFNEAFLKRWLDLFGATLESVLQPEQVQIWKSISQRMGHALSQKNEFMKAQIEG